MAAACIAPEEDAGMPDGGAEDGGVPPAMSGDSGAIPPPMLTEDDRLVTGSCGCAIPGMPRPTPLAWLALFSVVPLVRRIGRRATRI
jgi:hypothetical protein